MIIRVNFAIVYWILTECAFGKILHQHPFKFTGGENLWEFFLCDLN